MKIDPLKQYAKVQQQLTDKRARLEARLAEINAVLKPEVKISSTAPSHCFVRTLSLFIVESPFVCSLRRELRGHHGA
jgi:hypothetical protein